MPSRSRSSFSRTIAATVERVGARKAYTSSRLNASAAAPAPACQEAQTFMTMRGVGEPAGQLASAPTFRKLRAASLVISPCKDLLRRHIRLAKENTFSP